MYALTTLNVMPIDQPQTISFQGQATHGGGSCQVSLTTDTPPTKDSVFKVIKTIEGGCPSTNPGNVGTDPFGFGADEFTFSIPNTVPTGKNYTLAWTWFNKIGDREMYMNCAPITVPASSQRRAFREGDINILDERATMAASMAALPDMFRANIGSMSDGCSTAVSGTVLAIPEAHRGSNAQRIGSEPLTPPVGSCGGNAATSPAPPAPDAPPAPNAPTSVQPVTPPKPTTTAAPPAPPATTTTPAPPPPPPRPSAAAPAPVPGLLTGTCPTPGKSVCSPDGTAWGDCDENHNVVYQKVTPGTKCDPALGVEVAARRSRAFRV